MATESIGEIVPNAPKTPTRTIRVSDDLWNAVQAKAKEDGITVTSIIIKALVAYAFDTPDEEAVESSIE